MESQQGAAPCYLQKLLPSHPWQAREHEQDEGGEEHAVPHDVNLVERDEFAEQAGEAGKQHAEMKFQK